MINKSLTEQRVSVFGQVSNQIENSFLAILEAAEAREILAYKIKVGRSGVNWVHYRNKYGKKIATFVSPKEFRGYWWSKDYSTTVNLATGAKYQVSSNHCTCPSWEHHVKTGKKKQCKHQAMRSECVAKSLMEQVFKIEPNNVLPGLKLERSDDFTCVEYYLKAYCKDNPYSSPVQKRIGRIIETESGFMAAGMRGFARGVYKKQQEAINWILRYLGRDYEQIEAAYQETQKPVQGSCPKCGRTDLIPTWDNEPILCKHCGWVEKEESQIAA